MQKILIAEDDSELCRLFSHVLTKHDYEVTAVENGAEALDALHREYYDLLISDIMMPVMNGYELVKSLRESGQTIPVLMITAKGSFDDMEQGFLSGSDDYMVKPCNFRLLVARAMQLLKWRETQTANTETVKTTTASIGNEQPAGGETLFSSQADKVFCDKLTLFVAQHMSEADFNVDRLAEMMAMGRTKFYGKVKELTGMSPNKYLMQQRMQKAADLLADGELNVAEVSYRVGIQDPSYLNKCFKAQFGVAPSKYVQPAKD